MELSYSMLVFDNLIILAFSMVCSGFFFFELTLDFFDLIVIES